MSDVVAQANAPVPTKAPTSDSVGMGYLETPSRKLVTIYLPLIVFLIVLLFPFYWMAITS
jgi:multiple sugar transport system permease protein